LCQEGFDGEMTETNIEIGIVDPANGTRAAVENAARARVRVGAWWNSMEPLRHSATVEPDASTSAMTPRPRRSIIFLTVSGEERGLWGSDYFGGHPPVPLENIVANLNADMIGRNWTDTIVVIGKEHSDLGTTLDRVNGEHPELNMTAVDDLWPNERFYFRSDHYNFARRGVPILFFFNGTHPDYHRSSDHIDLIDEEKASRVAKLMFYLGLDIANRTARPQWRPESYNEIVK
jgi:Zn-dependent M28 family amino/carboxypeptidase